MKLLSLAAVAALTIPTATAFETGLHDPKVVRVGTVVPAKPSAPTNGYTLHYGRYWHRSPDGRWFVWTPGRWKPAANRADNTGTPQPTVPQVLTTRTSNYRPEVVTYPDENDRNVFFGIDWYANGRGRFSVWSSSPALRGTRFIRSRERPMARLSFVHAQRRARVQRCHEVRRDSNNSF